jgi:hypothetical protein
MCRGFTRRELLVVIAILFVLVALLVPVNVWVIEVPLTLAFGWATYLWRVVPKANPDPWTVGTAVACLAGVLVGSHVFLRWLVGRELWSWKRTLRCVGLVVLMFVAGIAVVGTIHQTSWLVRSPEPLVGGGLRQAPARIQSANNLKQIGIAVHNWYGNENPPEVARSTFTPTGEPLHSWQTALLPYLEESALYQQIDRTKPWTHPANATAMSTPLRVFRNPAIYDDTVNGYGASHYAGNAAVVLGDPKTFASFPAGTARTILAGEVSAHFRAWGDPLNARDPRLGASGHPQGFGGANGKPAQFIMLDGSVQTFDPKALAELMGNPSE